jgi:hypothetical protein
MTAIDKNLKITRFHAFVLIFLALATVVSSCVNAPGNDIDIDFTALSKTLIQAEILRIEMNTESYLGKTMRMSGRYDPAVRESGELVHFLILVEGDECCQMGFEFKLADGVGYPAIDALIEITGVLMASGSGHVYVAVSAIESLEERK